MNPGIDNKPFEIIFKENWYYDGLTIDNIETKLIIKGNPIKNHWIYDTLFYLSLGLYDRRGYIYKVKIIK